MTSIIYADDLELEWTHPDQPGQKLPAFLDIPIRIRPGYDQDEPDQIVAMDLHVDVHPWLRLPGTHFANQHDITREECFGTIWHNEGVKPRTWDVFGSPELGFRALVDTPREHTQFGSGGWGRISINVQRYYFPVAADGILAWVRVFSRGWLPSMQLVHTDAGPTVQARTRAWNIRGEEVELIHEPHYFLLWDDTRYGFRRKDMLAKLPTIAANIDGHVRPIEREIVPYTPKPKVEYQE